MGKKTKLPTYILTNPNSGRHLYGRGWLGLIPIIGAFVGIGLVVLGIVKYKDKKLTLIGVGCILFTVILYGSIFYYGFYTTAGRKQFIPVAKMTMNDLIKDIEFYKLQNGEYPDSLEQLKKNNNLAIIYDPISAKDNKTFYYKKIGNHYTLFSTGIDKIPFTQDDVYPDIDTSKIGLIKNLK